MSTRAYRDDAYQRRESRLLRDRVTVAQDREVVPDVPRHHVGERPDGNRLAVAAAARLPLRLLEAPRTWEGSGNVLLRYGPT